MWASLGDFKISSVLFCPLSLYCSCKVGLCVCVLEAAYCNKLNVSRCRWKVREIGLRSGVESHLMSVMFGFYHLDNFHSNNHNGIFRSSS